MKSYNVLDCTSPIYGKIFLEASAGTGKTFAIEHMVVRQVLDGIPITKILVVTFTKAGAQDLKNRIHTLLLHVKDRIDKDELNFSYLKIIKDKDEAALLIDNACILASDMPICTIHSFAYMSLSSFAFEGNIDFDLLHFEDEKQKDVILTAILDVMRAETSEDNISSIQCIKMMDAFERKLPLLTKKIASFIENDKDLPPLTTYKEILKSFHKIIDKIDKKTILQEFLVEAPSYKRTTNRQKDIHPKFINQIQALYNKDLEHLMLSSPSIIELLQEDNLKKGKTHNSSFSLLTITKKLLPLLKIAKDPTTALVYIARKAKKRLENQSVKGPDSILLSMQEAIKLNPFKERVQTQYECCIIDEFQDTDPIQWDILSKLFINHKTFCTVGDPKQSIYAFRGADLPTYLQAKKQFPTYLSLDTNYRSHPHIIKVLNNLFNEKITPAFLSFEKESHDLRYHEVIAGRNPSTKGSIEFHFCHPPKEKTIRKSLKEAETSFFLPHICNTVKSLDTNLDTIAILVKDRYQGLFVSLYLKSKNIPVKANISASLIEDPLFMLFETLLFFTYNPRSESLLKKLLSHKIINAPLDLLKEDLNNPILQNLSIQFTLLLHTLETKGINAYLAALLSAKLFEGSSLEELLCKEEEHYLTFMQIISLFLTNFEKDPKLFVAEIQKLNEDVFTFLKKGTGTDKQSVTIMTSHLSKGLEFETVFALSLYTRMKQSVKTEKEAQLIDKEKMRLLYVTMTRAKSYLYVYGTLFGDLFPLEKGNGSPLELFLSRVNQPFLNYVDLYERAQTLSYKSVSSLKPLPITLMQMESCSPWRRDGKKQTAITPTPLKEFKKPAPSLSFSMLPFQQHEIVRVEQASEFPYGAAVGNQIHLLFEKIIEEGLYYPFTKDVIFPIISKSFFQTDLEGFEEIVFEKLEQVFTTKLTSNFSTFSLEEINPSHFFPEVLFHYQMNNTAQEMKGFIDLIAFHQGKYYIIDWKCNHLEGYEQKDLKNALEKHHYTKQASIYTRALKSFLEAKNLPFDKYAGGVFYIFVRAGKNGPIYFTPKAMKDSEVLCLK